jgi:hypothetical protein
VLCLINSVLTYTVPNSRPQILNDFLVRLPSEPVTGLQGYLFDAAASKKFTLTHVRRLAHILCCSIDTIMQTIMGIKAPAMIQRPAREQLQWPVLEARIKVRCKASFILIVIRPLLMSTF